MTPRPLTTPCYLDLYLDLDLSHYHYQYLSHYHHHSLKPSAHATAPIYAEGLAGFAWVESNDGACATAPVWGDTTSSTTHGPGEVTSLPRPDSRGRHQHVQYAPTGYQCATARGAQP
jgi:hypothetical protein